MGEQTPPEEGQSETTVSCEAFAAMLNLSGKRRYASQRLVLYAVLASMQYPGALTTAFQSLETFRSAHTALMNPSDTLPGIFCPELQQAYFGDDVADMQIRSFIDLAEGTLVAIGSGSPEASDLLVELINGATPNLEILDGITTTYEQVASHYAKSLKAEIRRLMNEIEDNASQARHVISDAKAAASRAGPAGEEFLRAAHLFSSITSEIDSIAKKVLNHADV